MANRSIDCSPILSSAPSNELWFVQCSSTAETCWKSYRSVPFADQSILLAGPIEFSGTALYQPSFDLLVRASHSVLDFGHLNP
jgi:hypothetical protein